MFRLPYADTYTKIEGKAQTLTSVEALDGREGFVVAPFDCCHPAVVLISGETSQISLNTELGQINSASYVHTPSTPTRDYSIAFEACHNALTEGRCEKIVLARQKTVTAAAVDPVELFLRACALYPRVMVALVSTPQTGTWLVATPETLLASHDGQWRTVALAGTMLWDEDVNWSAKNRREQQYVADFISHRLATISTHINRGEPHTVRAGHLAHLRTDFTFEPLPNIGAGEMLARLHPTPAVCGLPQTEAMTIITATEPQPRRYYSGFLGMLRQKGDTDIFVNLRSMELLSPTIYRLYAGGGLIKESDCQTEWQETEDKMRTMGKLLDL